MADALCGPSNALQNFQKHTSVDRTLQQDRLVSSRPSPQNFRSPHPSTSHADSELAAFESGAPAQGPAFTHPAQQPQPLHHPPPFAHPAQAHPAEAGWASDFQRLNISNAPQQPLHPQQPFALPYRASPSNWQDEFVRQQQHPQAAAASPSNASQRLFGTMGAMSYSPMSNMSYASQYQSPAFQPSVSQTQSQPAEPSFDDAAFEAAFAEARAQVEQIEQQNTTEQAPREETRTEETQHAQENEQTEIPRIGADTIEDRSKDGVDQSDDLARTAGQLLESVQHETNEKFRESNFLALMRQLRDREVVVEGDEFRQVTQPLHPGGEHYPDHHVGRSSTATPNSSEIQITEQEKQEKSQQQQPHDDEPPPLPVGHGYETSYGSNYTESKSIGDNNVLYDGMPWENGVLPPYLRVI